MKILVIGGGPAGMMAAGVAAENGADVVLLEKNEKLGKKLYITGKGRCNLTNNTDVAGLLAAVNTNSRFLNSAFYALDSVALMAFFEERLGLPLKTERGGRVFPVSDFSGDVNTALERWLRKVGVDIRLGVAVKKIANKNVAKCDDLKKNKFVANLDKLKTDAKIADAKTVVKTASSFTLEADAVIIATGGLSYPSTGSTGDGYAFARALGHSIAPTYPALVPLITEEKWVRGLEGLSLKNVRCTVHLSGKSKKAAVLYEEIGEMLFTAKGVTGPLILSASAFLCDKLDGIGGNSVDKPASPTLPHATPILTIDLKPALTAQQLDARVLRDFAANQNKNFANSLDELLPRRMIDTIIALSGISPHKKVHTITREERTALVAILKALPLTPIATAGFAEAVITKGGINCREINPSTLMSKKIPGLFFAGEIIDTDAKTGGYNLQIAFATGYLAGHSASEKIGGSHEL